MIAVVAPEPAPWLVPVVEAALLAGRVVVFAPWGLPPALARLAPSRFTAALQRRTLTVARFQPTHGWFAVEALARLWSRDRTDREMVARFALRRAVGELAARWLPPDCDAVIAPSLAARNTFAAAARRNVATLLVEDVPSLRALHADLDAASARHPGALFLKRFRASPTVVAEQEAERVLARHVLVRGHFSRDLLGDRGGEAVLDLPASVGATGRVVESRDGRPTRVLLAGLAAARHGTFEALDAVRGLPVELLVRAGEGTEPRDLLGHPRVRSSTREERETLVGVDVVIAPSWCESHAPEVALAAAMGVPVVATRRGAGLVDLGRAGVEVPPGDAVALAAGIERALTMTVEPPVTSRAGATLTARLQTIMRRGAPAPRRVVRLPVIS